MIEGRDKRHEQRNNLVEVENIDNAAFEFNGYYNV